MRVSLCTIARNEERALNGLLRDFRDQNYPHNKIEIIMVDSNSTDRTHELMDEFKETDNGFYAVKVYTCYGSNQAAAWNVAIEHATGDIIIRVDAHAQIPRQFVSRNVFNIKEGENVVGGGRPNICANPNPWTKTLQAAEESLFGSSVADYRRPAAQKEYHDSLFHAAYRREVFAKVGGFNEDLGRTEDNEMHYRIRQAGYKICCCPEIISFQHTRSTLKHMISQKYGNGYWIGLTVGVCPKCLSYFHFIPFVFLLSIIGSLLFWIVTGQPVLLAIIAAMYAMFNMVNTVGAFILKKTLNPMFLILPFLFPILHLSYGVGTLVGLIKLPRWKKSLDGSSQRRIEEVKQAVKNNTVIYDEEQVEVL
ncbi:glycosyltransferase family 2 protein [uncultured Ruminococcus sp.]|uniref:glycosyltransferase family 2 protein n=1 Tax=uncultured Ruminococcus sp. TaxID=165186 RepID=UPI00292F86B8|nr:glycosyltransferase family 2 protein [uncultured Ruminococcus sp.]